MRQSTCCLLFAFFACVLSPLSAGAQVPPESDSVFPYQALVLREGAEVRSGPASVHYATEKLAQGTLVKVHRHDPNGWNAIEPTESSFSMVPQSAVELVSDRVGRITVDGAQAWVGTRLGAVEKPLWQIKLKQDEEVWILGEISWPHPEGHSTIWYQIAPPNGEFRWIKMADLQLPGANRFMAEPKKDVVSVDAGELRRAPAPSVTGHEIETDAIQPMRSQVVNAQAQPAVPATIAKTSVQQAGLQTTVNRTKDRPAKANSTVDSGSMLTESQSLNHGWRAATVRRERGKTTDRRFDERLANRTIPNQFIPPAIPDSAMEELQEPIQETFTVAQAALQTPVTSPTIPESNFANTPNNFSQMQTWNTNQPVAARPKLQEIPAGDVDFHLTEIDLAISRQMTKEPNEWLLDDLSLKAEAVRRAATTPQQQQAAGALMTRIERCQRIRKGFMQAYNEPTANMRGGSLPSDQPIGSGIDPKVELSATYDAHGWLNQVTSTDGTGKPMYVLQDSQGNVTHHIAPSLGLNLNRYLKSHVGVVGQRGFHRRLNLDHVTAERVIEIRKLR